MKYVPKHFKFYELVPHEIYLEFGEGSRFLFDDRILRTADQIREFFNKPVVCNNWYWGGRKNFRGFRPADCTIGALFSQHKFGRALDLTINGVTSVQARDIIMNHQAQFPYITRIEDNVPWLHIDCANVHHNGIHLFQP